MTSDTLEDWLRTQRIDEVECLLADMSGTARGKILPASKFIKGLHSRGLRVPEEVFSLTVTGRYVWETDAFDAAAIHIYLRPDVETLRIVPWYSEPTAEVICDCFYVDDRPVEMAPRYVLKRVLELYKERGWKPIVAPELEFYLVKRNLDPDYPLEPPVGRSGRQEAFGQAYGIDAANEFDPVVEDIYAWCEAQNIDLDTLSHESGPAQLEINFNHGDPLLLADQVFLFKRTVRQAALKHDMYATFMAKPHEKEPGSSMHLHQSVADMVTGENLFGAENGEPSALLLNHIGGLQRYLGAAMPFCAPNVNSYRRLVPDSDAPTNVHWGKDNRTVSFRVPTADRDNMPVRYDQPQTEQPSSGDARRKIEVQRLIIDNAMLRDLQIQNEPGCCLIRINKRSRLVIYPDSQGHAILSEQSGSTIVIHIYRELRNRERLDADHDCETHLQDG